MGRETEPRSGRGFEGGARRMRLTGRKVSGPRGGVTGGRGLKGRGSEGGARRPADEAPSGGSKEAGSREAVQEVETGGRLTGSSGPTQELRSCQLAGEDR